MADVLTQNALQSVQLLAKLGIENGKCTISDHEFGREIAKADKNHALGIGIVTKAIEQLPNNASDEMSTQLTQQMQAVIMVGALSDTLKITRALCKRIDGGLQMPNGNKLPGLGR